jgi:hypothetical protein
LLQPKSAQGLQDSPIGARKPSFETVAKQLEHILIPFEQRDFTTLARQKERIFTETRRRIEHTGYTTRLYAYSAAYSLLAQTAPCSIA